MIASASPTWSAVKRARREAWEVIDRVAEDALGWLEQRDAFHLSMPCHGGEWDWFWTLSKAERRRIVSRWCCEHGRGPDEVTDEVGLEHGRLMDEWLRCTRVLDAAASLRIRKYHGYTPGTASLGGLTVDDLFMDSGYELVELFASQPACTDYMARVLADDAEWGEPWAEDDQTAFWAEYEQTMEARWAAEDAEAVA